MCSPGGGVYSPGVMMAIQEQSPATGETQVELIDNWHSRWGDVIDLLTRTGGHSAVGIDENGWLSARCNLLVAFVENEPVGYLCFHITPVGTTDGKPRLDALVDCFLVEPRFRGRGLEERLTVEAKHRSKELRCQTLRTSDGRVL